MDLPFLLVPPLPGLPPVPVLDSVEPRRWWSWEGWPDKQRWPTGANWMFSLAGADFDPESLVLLGTRALVPNSCSSTLITVWIVPPEKPGILPMRVRTGPMLSNPIPITFT